MATVFLLVPMGVKGEDIALITPVLQRNMPIKSKWLVTPDPLEPPLDAYSWDRMQYDAGKVNRYLHLVFKNYIESGVYVIGIVGADGFVEGLNFVFGLASRDLKVASVFTSRLDTTNRELADARIAKEILHEAGHLLGLGHCGNPRCVMRFSVDIRGVDFKGLEFCSSCSIRLSSMALENHI